MIWFAGEDGWAKTVIHNPLLYVLFMWHHDTIDKSDPSVWVDVILEQ
jgi:hypothetical protein